MSVEVLQRVRAAALLRRDVLDGVSVLSEEGFAAALRSGGLDSRPLVVQPSLPSLVESALVLSLVCACVSVFVSVSLSVSVSVSVSLQHACRNVHLSAGVR
jgi:hypothetical protein